MLSEWLLCEVPALKAHMTTGHAPLHLSHWLKARLGQEQETRLQKGSVTWKAEAPLT